MNQNNIPQDPYSPPQSTLNPTPGGSASTTTVGEFIDASKNIWKEHGIFLLKGYLPFGIGLAIAGFIIQLISIGIELIGVPFVGVLTAPFSFLIGAVSYAISFGMYRPFRDVVLQGQNAIPSGKSFLSLSREHFGQLTIFWALAFVLFAMGLCFLLVPGIIVMAIAMPAAYLIATRGQALGEAIQNGVEIAKANVAPILALLGAYVAIAVVLFIPAIVLVAGAAMISTVLSSLISAVVFTLVGFALSLASWFAIGCLLVTIIDAPSSQTSSQPQANTW